MALVRPRRLPFAVVLLAVFFLVPSLVQFYTDWLWFGEVGYQHVFVRAFSTKSTLGAAALGLGFAFLFVNFRLAFRTLTRREIVVVTPDGPRVIAVDPSRLKPFVGLAAAPGRSGARRLCRIALGGLAASIWQRDAVRQGRSHPRPRRRVLPVRAAVPAAAAVAGAAGAGTGHRRRRRPLSQRGSPRPGADAGVLRQAAGARPSVGAGRALADRPGLRRLAGDPGAPHESLTAHPRRDLRGRARAHARAARAEHRRGARRAARRLPGVPGAPVADRHRLRALCRRLARRRWHTPPPCSGSSSRRTSR